jgi:hypothetical protein
MICTSGRTAGSVVSVVDDVVAFPARIVVDVVVVALWAFASNSGSSLNRDPRAMSRELSMGVSTQRQPDPGSAGSMIANSLPTAVEIGTAGSTYVGVAADAAIVEVVDESLLVGEDPPEQPATRAAMPAARMRALRRR